MEHCDLCGERHPTSDSDQLELELMGRGLPWREPWSGKSPRVLTEAYEKFSLGAPPARGLRD